MNKYKILRDQFVEILGKKLYRIQALKDFDDVKAGDTGGYIENESNLSQSGNAQVYGNARVCGNAQVYGNAWVYDTRHYLNLGPIGSRDGYTTIYRDKSKKAILANQKQLEV